VPLKIVGVGPDRGRLERQAGSDVAFLGRRSNDEIRTLYQRAAFAMLPGEEDFGIVPLEAQACGRPVIAYARGGALETVIPGETGTLVDDATPAAFAEAITETLAHTFDSALIRAHAERFGRERFGDEITALVDETVDKGPAAW
jgi:glycosyltransferase involved in cell wall biosynthesis